MTIRVAITQERHADETRVAATPETVKKLIGLGSEIVVQSGAGLKASTRDGCRACRRQESHQPGDCLLILLAPKLSTVESNSYR